ncbi:hypothetical protein NFI96_006494 [Prochilodus magdalenae]|nr:hypothetical protein NFI96_006494 [Prochilodus magdalenae]
MPSAFPLGGFMSLGELHALPTEKVNVRNRFPPQDLIHRAFILEQGNKISPEDILRGPKRSRKPEVQNLLDSKFRLSDMDDTDGEGLRSPLLKLWNTLRGIVQMDGVQYSTVTQQVQRADRMLPRPLKSGQVSGTNVVLCVCMCACYKGPMDKVLWWEPIPHVHFFSR